MIELQTEYQEVIHGKNELLKEFEVRLTTLEDLTAFLSVPADSEPIQPSNIS